MKATYDKKRDVLYIVLRDIEVANSDEQRRGVTFDFDKDSNLVGIEILRASECVDNPAKLDFTTVE
ncbi:MAG: DUF2283 domain-containing protein [Chloroflexi bacterium]|nr:DUF2283 domain-containing protein [Chloroflexota bacterium]